MNREAILREFGRPDSVLCTVLNSIFDGVYVVDPGRRIIFWNRAAEEITGYPAKKIKDSKDLIALADKAMYIAKKAGRNRIAVL